MQKVFGFLAVGSSNNQALQDYFTFVKTGNWQQAIGKRETRIARITRIKVANISSESLLISIPIAENNQFV